MKYDKTASRYLSTTQAAQRLGLSVGTVQRMVESGVLQAYTTQGGHRRIAEAGRRLVLARPSDRLLRRVEVHHLRPGLGRHFGA